MSSDTSPTSKLQKLLGLEPSLGRELGAAESLDQAASLIQSTGRRHNLSFDIAELIALFQAVNQRSSATYLSDDELEGVEGGGDLFLRVSDVGMGKALAMLGTEEFQKQLTKALNHVNQLHEENRARRR